MTRGQTWLALIVVGIGLAVSAVLGLFAYMSLTAAPLHPDAQQVPSVLRSAPIPAWADAVERGRQLVRASVVEQNLPGVSVAVAVGGDIVWAEGFGWADLDKRLPVAPEMRFRAANVSIPLTSAAVGLLLEKNRLDLDAEIQTYVPDFPKKPWPVTLRQLMAHQAGIRNDAGDEEPLHERCDRTVDGLRRFAEDSLRFEPGTEFRPSSYGWILVSAAVESAAAQPFFTFMRTHIFEPLGMDRTRVDSAAEPIADRVAFYFPRFAADNRYGPEPARDGDHSCFAGAGAFLSTPSDLVRFGMAVGSGTLLQPATVDTLHTPQKLRSGQPTEYGLGWRIQSVPFAGGRTRMAGHDTKADFIGGAATLMTFPEHRLVVAVMSNTSFADTSTLALSVADAFAPQGAR